MAVRIRRTSQPIAAEEPPEEENTIRRTIRFYSTVLVHNGRVADDQSAIWTLLASRPFANPPNAPLGGRTRVRPDGESEALTFSVPDAREVRCRMVRDRTSDFPLVADGESDEPLNIGNRALRDPMHFVWWNLGAMRTVSGTPLGNEGLLVAESARPGPSALSLPEYVRERTNGDFKLEIVPLINPNTWQRLEDENFEVKSIKARVPMTNREMPTGPMSGLDIAHATANVRELQWELKPRRGQLLDLRGARERLYQVLDRRTVEGRTEAIRVYVQLQSGETLPLQEARASARVKVIPTSPDSRSVEPESMFAAIVQEVQSINPAFARSLGRHWLEYA